MIGQCLCGRVTVEVSRPPEEINICNCRFCRSLGAAWGYFTTAEVTVTGKTGDYRREDLSDIWLAGHFCLTCGSTTHYTYTEQHARDRVAVNMRLFAQDALEGMAVKWQDGRAVHTKGDEFVVTGRGHIGDGKAF